MRSAILAALLAATAYGQPLPYSFHKSGDAAKPDAIDATSLQEDFENLANQIHQQKVTTSNLIVTGVVTSVGAGTPLCSSGGVNPSITFCGSLAESQVTNLVSDLANKVALSAYNNFVAAVAASTASIAVSTTSLYAGSTAYLHVDGGNAMAGALQLPNDVNVQWNSSLNNINGDATRINVVVNGATGLTVTPGGVTAATGTFTAGVTAASGTFTNGVTASSYTVTSSGGVLLPNDVNVQWNNANNNLNGDSTRINTVVNGVIGLSVTPSNTIAAGSSTAMAFYGSGANLTGLYSGATAQLGLNAIAQSLEFISSVTVALVAGSLPAATYSVGVAPINANGAEGRMQAAAQNGYVLDGSHAMQVKWPTITGAASYRVYISTSGDYQRFFPASASPLTVNTATQVGIDPSTLVVSSASASPGTSSLAAENWYFGVSAVFADGGMTQDGMNIGTENYIRTISSGATITVSWTAVGAATSYRLYVGNDQNGGGPRMHLCYVAVSGTSKTLNGSEAYVCGASALPYGDTDSGYSAAVIGGAFIATANEASRFASDVKIYPGPQSDAAIHIIRYNAKGAASKVTFGQAWPSPTVEYYTLGMMDTDGGNPTDPQRFLFRNQNGTVIWSAMSTNATNPAYMGVGNGAPATQLDVTGNMQIGAAAQKSTFTTTGALTIGSADTIPLQASNGNFNPFVFHNTSGADSNPLGGNPVLGLGAHSSISLITSGNVGINAIAPGATLDVGGNAQFGTTAKSTFSTTGALTLPNDVGVNWNNSNNNINGDSTRINLVVNNIIGMTVNPGGIAVGTVAATYGVSAGSFTTSGNLTASSGTFTATGAAQFSINTSSGILVPTNTPVCWGSLAAANCQYKPAVAAAAVNYSTKAISSGYTTTNTSFKDCVTGSTGTLVTLGNPVAVLTSGYASNAVATDGVNATIEVDGGFPVGFANNIPITGFTSTAIGAVGNTAMSIVVPLSAGTHNFCIALNSAGGTATVTWNGGTIGVYEIH